MGSSDASQQNFQLIPCNSANASQDTLTSNPTTCDYNALVLTVQRFINLLLYASGFIAVILVVFAGFKYLTAGGDTNKTTQARKILSAAVIGMIIAFCSWLVVNTVVNSFISSSFSGGVVVNPLKQQ